MTRLAMNAVSNRKLTILNFHKVPYAYDPLQPDEIDFPDFCELINYLRRMFNIIPLEDALRCVMHNREGRRMAAITFDDGDVSWTKHIAPFLLKEQIHATFFCSTGQIEGDPLWNESLVHLVRSAKETTNSIDWTEHGLLGEVSFAESKKIESIRGLERFLKYQRPERRAELLRELAVHTGVEISSVPTIGVEEIKLLHSSGFGVGAHSVTHPILKMCNQEQANKEIHDCKERLESIVRSPVRGFAYPNGIPGQDFANEHVSMVQKAGYEYAVTTQRGYFGSSSSIYEIPRFSPWGRSNLKRNAQILRNLIKGNSRPALDVASKRRRVLMVAFHFPPQSGSSGVLRTLNNSKYLPVNGWDASVLTVKQSVYEKTSSDLIDSIPMGVRVTRCAAIDSAKGLSIKGRYLEMTALPDRWGSWLISGAYKGWKEIRLNKADVIWSTYPIATAHLVALMIAKITRTPLVTDFRDPMADSGYEAGVLQRKTRRLLEEYSIKHSEFSVFTTQGAKELYASRYPRQAEKFHVIENGFDEDLFKNSVPNRYGVLPEIKLILHSGIVYADHRDPAQFLEAISRLIEKGVIERDRIRVRFRAPGDAHYLAGIIEKKRLTDVVEIAPALPYAEAVAEMMGADLLVILQGTHFNAQVPAKLYEYVRAKRDILGVVDPSGDTAKQLRQFSRVFLADISGANELFDVIKGWLHLPQTNVDRSEGLKLIEKYSRQSQAKILAGLLDRVVSQKGTLPPKYE